MKQDLRYFLLSWPAWTSLLVIVAMLLLVRQLDPPTDALQLNSVIFQQNGAAHLPPGEITKSERVALPHEWRHRGYKGTEAWYVEGLQLNVPPNRLWGIYLPEIATNVGVYLNGESLGEGGTMTPPVARNSYRPQYFAIPNGMLAPDVNQIAIHIVSDPGGQGYLGPVFLGPDELVRPAYKRNHFVRVTLVEFIAISKLILTFFIGILGVRTRDPVYFYFSAMLATWFCFDVSLLVLETPLPGKFWDWLRLTSIGWFVVFLVLFMHRFLHLLRPRIETVLLLWGLLGAILLAIVPSGWMYPLGWYGWDALAMGWGAYALLTALNTCRQTHSVEHLSITLSGMVLLLMGFRDWLVVAGIMEGIRGYLFVYTAPYPMIIFALVLLRRFTFALEDAATLNRELEERVNRREAELARTYKQFTRTQKQRALTEERERIMRDMHDGIGGQLVSAIATSKSGSQEELGDILETALTDLRLMIDSFEPIDNDLTTVLGLLRMRLEKRLKNHGLQFDWRVEDIPEIPELGPDKALQVMRILQEAVTNVVRHANASRITVASRSGEHDGFPGVFIEIIDNGDGIDDQIQKGKGLDNMQHRAQVIGGRLLVESSNPGTRVCLWLPVSPVRPSH